jgi:hypothetical protein
MPHKVMEDRFGQQSSPTILLLLKCLGIFLQQNALEQQKTNTIPLCYEKLFYSQIEKWNAKNNLKAASPQDFDNLETDNYGLKLFIFER